MTRKLKTGSSIFAALALGFILSTHAQATHFHFEDYGDAEIDFAVGGAMETYTWSFDLDTDIMDLWALPADGVQSQGYDFITNSDNYAESSGSMLPGDFLHYAYLTMKFTGVNGDSEDETITFELLGDMDLLLGETEISQGGLPKNTELVTALVNLDNSLLANGANLDVTSYLRDDHMLDVTITALNGSFSVEKLDLAGCFGSTPVPEPATMLLFGTGLVGIAGFSRKKLNKKNMQ